MTIHRASLGVPNVIISDIVGGTGATEQAPSQDQNPCSSPADVERCSQLSLLCRNQGGVVEITNDGVSGPADWNKHQEAGNDEDNSSSYCHSALLHFVFDKICALASNHRKQNPKNSSDDGDDSECSGSLQVLS